MDIQNTQINSKYEVTRTVRMGLKGKILKPEFPVNNYSIIDLCADISRLNKLIDDFFYHFDKNQKKCVYSNLKLNYKQVAKIYPYRYSHIRSNKIRYYEITEFESEFFEYHTKLVCRNEELNNLSERSNTEHRKPDNAELLIQIRALRSWDILYYWELIHNHIVGLTGDQLSKNNSILELIEKILDGTESLSNSILSSDRKGVTVHKSTFNYFTAFRKYKEPAKYEALKKKYGGLLEMEYKVYNNVYDQELSYFKNKLSKSFEASRGINGFTTWVENFYKNELIRKNNIQKDKKTYNGLLEIEYIINLYDKPNIKNSLQIDDLNIVQLKIFLREYKAQQKNALTELTQKYISGCGNINNLQEEINNKVPLFKDCNSIILCKSNAISILQKYWDHSNEIHKINQNNSPTDDKNDNLRHIEVKQRNLIFNDTYLRDWLITNTNKKHDRSRYDAYLFTKLLKLIQEISLLVGQIRSLKLAVEYENIDSKNINSWSIFMQNEYGLSIVMFDKGKLIGSNIYENLLSMKATDSNSLKLIILDSLTLRALDKLCFEKSDNSFNNRCLLEELCGNKNFDLFLDKRKQAKIIIKRKDEILKLGEHKLIEYFQIVLGTNHAKQKLSLKYFSNLRNITDLNNKYPDLVSFEIALKQACYIRTTVNIDRTEFDKIKLKYAAREFSITSYDLEKKKVNEDATNQTGNTDFVRKKLKYNTSEIWNKFWNYSDNCGSEEIRINPDFSLSYISKQQDIIKRKENDIDKVGYHRSLNERNIANFTFNTSSSGKRVDLAFKGERTLIDKINKFNKNFNKTNLQRYNHIVGIDRGNAELATIGVFKQPAQGADELKRVEIQTYKIKDYLEEAIMQKKLQKDGTFKETKTIAFKNPSYATIVSDEKVTCIDCSMAKIVNNKLVVDGDISTYLKFLIVVAKYKIKMLYDSGQLVHFQLTLGKKSWMLGTEEIFYFNNKLAILPDYNKINCILNGYILELKSGTNPDLTLEINNVRRALCANIVGILKYLHQGYKISYMLFLEDLDVEQREKNCGFGSHLERAIVNFFSQNNLLPPFIKEFMKFSTSDQFYKSEIDFNTSRKDSIKSEVDEVEKKLVKKKNHLNSLRSNSKSTPDNMSKSSNEISVLTDDMLNKKKELADIDLQIDVLKKQLHGIMQFGKLGYVETNGTSSCCPNCQNKITKDHQKLFKWTPHHFVCEKNCGFTTNNTSVDLHYCQIDPKTNVSQTVTVGSNKIATLNFLNSSDDVACYNIAKRGYEYLQNLKK